MKAALAVVVPALLADRGDPHSILVLSGKPGIPEKSYLDCRTISAQDAKRTLISLSPTLNSISTEIDTILVRRNTALHLNILTEADATAAARSLAISVDALAPFLHINLSEFWGEALYDYAMALVEKAMDERRLLLQQLEAAARERLERLKQIDPQVLELWATERSAPPEETEDNDEGYREAHQCPICEWWGWLYGSISRGEVFVLDHRYGTDLLVERTWDSSLFICEVCGLRLEGAVLNVSGFAISQSLEAVPADEEEALEYSSRWDDSDYWYEQQAGK